MSAASEAALFVSYSRKDLTFVKDFADALTARGYTVWRDQSGLPPAVPWEDEVRFAIERSDSLLFVISPDSTASVNARLEVEHAVECRKRLIPLVRREVDPAVVPEPLRALNWIWCASDADVTAALDATAAALETDLEWARSHTELLRDALQWTRSRRHPTRLLRGRELARTVRLLGEHRGKKPEPTALQLEFVAASARAQRRRRLSLAGTMAFLLVVLAAAAYGLFTQASEAYSRRIAGNGSLLLDTDPEVSLLLSREAMDIASTDDAVRLLRRSLASHHLAKLLPGHPSAVRALAFRPAGEQKTSPARQQRDVLVAVSDDNGASVWDVQSGTAQRLALPFQSPMDVTFSPDGRLCALWGSVPTEAATRVYDASSWEPLVDLPGGRPVFSRDGRLLMTVARDGSARIWVTGTEALRRPPVTTRPTSPLVQGGFVTHANVAVAVGEDSILRAWDVVTGRLRFERPLATDDRTSNWADVLLARESVKPGGTFDDWRSLMSSPNGQWLAASGGTETSSVLWNVSDADPARWRPVALVPGKVTAFDHASTMMITDIDDGTLRVYNLLNPGQLRAALRGHTSYVTGCVFSENDQYAVTISHDATARVWDVSSGTQVAVLPGHRGRVQSVAVDSRGGLIATGGDDREVRLWRTAGWHSRVALEARAGGFGVQFSPDGATMAYVDGERTFRVFETGSGRPRCSPREGPHRPARPAFDGRSTRVAIGHAHGRVSITDLTSCTTTESLPRAGTSVSADTPADVPGQGHVSVLAFDADGRRVFTGDDTGAVAWVDTSTRPPRTLAALGSEVLSLSISPDDAYLAAGTMDGRAVVLDPDDGRPIATVRHPTQVLQVRFLRDGRTLVSSGGNTFVRDARAATPTLTFNGLATAGSISADEELIAVMNERESVAVFSLAHGSLITQLVDQSAPGEPVGFSSGADVIVTSGSMTSASALRAWEARSGLPLARLGPAVSGAGMHPGGTLVAGFDAVGVGLYQCDPCGSPAALAALANARVTRQLTPAERAQYVAPGGVLLPLARRWLARAGP